MTLSGKQLQTVQEALLDGFPSLEELRMLARFELEQNLNAIAGGENLRVVVFNLLTWAEQHNRLPDLIEGACRRNGGNAALRALAAESRRWFAAPAAAAAPAPPPHPQRGPAAIDLFLCYSHQDLLAARRLQELLRGAGLAVWLDEGLEAGTLDWEEAIAEAIHQARGLVALLSPPAKASRWVRREVSYAQTQGKRVFPLLLAGDEIDAVPLSLMDVQWVDGRGGLEERVRTELLPALLRHLGRAAPAAPVAPLVDPALLAARKVEAKRYIDSGREFHRQGDYARAIAEYSKAIELDPNNAEYYNSRGISYHNAAYYKHPSGDYARAIADKTKAIELDPNNAKYYFERGKSYHEAARNKHPSGDYARAIADDSKAIELDPKNGSYYYSRAITYRLMGRSRDAEQDEETARGLGYQA